MRISHAPPGSQKPDISGISSSSPTRPPAGPDATERSPLDLQPLVPGSTRRTRVPRWLRRTTGPLVLLVLWQLLSATGVLTPDVLASRGRIAEVGRDLIADGSAPTGRGARPYGTSGDC